MKITKELLDETIDLLSDSNDTAGGSMMALKMAHESGLSEDLSVPFTVDEMMTILQATKQAYDILLELRESL